MLISFGIFFINYKYNTKKPLIIKDDNNATYAYNMGKKKRHFIKKLLIKQSKNKNNDNNIENNATNRNNYIEINTPYLK